MRKLIFKILVIGMIVGLFFFPTFLGAILNCGMWLFSLKFATPSIGFFENFVIGTIVTAIAFWIVGKIFKKINFYNKKIMCASYFASYTIVSFGLSTIVYILTIVCN